MSPANEGSVSSWSVVAHSLGCAITHDVLHAMDATSPSQDGISILDAMVPSASVVAMISNVSKVLENDVGVYDSQLVPPTQIKPNTACFHYLSANNKFDPFVLSERFDPKNEPEWTQAKKNKSFLDIRISNVHEVNVHSFKNYLVNPDVHIPLFERMAGRGTISSQDVASTVRWGLASQLRRRLVGRSSVCERFAASSRRRGRRCLECA